MFTILLSLYSSTTIFENPNNSMTTTTTMMMVHSFTVPIHNHYRNVMHYNKSLLHSTVEKETVNGEVNLKEKEKKKKEERSLSDQLTSSSVASAAALATAAVNAAVSMRSLSAPDIAKSYISLDDSDVEIDGDGLPLQYDKDAIEKYWQKERGALNQRWRYFVGKVG